MLRLFYIAFSILIASCYPSYIHVEKGNFQTTKPPNIYGNERYLEKGRHSVISYEANIGKNKTMFFTGIMNTYKDSLTGEILSETPVDINYRLIENTLGFQFYHAKKISKWVPFYFGGGGGMQNFPYGFFTLGFNGKFMEIGGVIFGGVDVNKASYEGALGDYDDFFSTGFNPDSENYEYVRIKDITIVHPYGGLAAHTSFYWEKIALSYAISVSLPWFLGELPVSRFESYDTAFPFPYLLMQDVGVSYAPDKIKYRLGVNQISGEKSPGQYWGLSIQMAYGW